MKKKQKKPTALAFKHEGEQDGMVIGPLFVRYGGTKNNPYSGTIKPLKEGEEGFAEWCTLRQARKIAKAAHLPLEEV